MLCLISVCRGKFIEGKDYENQEGKKEEAAVMCRKTAVKILEVRSNNLSYNNSNVTIKSENLFQNKAAGHINNLMMLFSLIDDFGCTLDFWSKGGKSYMGVNIHFIDNDLEIHSFTIALERFRGSHDYLSVAIRLNALFTKFGIIGKVGAVTTDQGPELVACFKHCGDDYVSYHGWCDNDENTVWPNEIDQIENEEYDASDVVPIDLLPESDEITETQINDFLAAMEDTVNDSEHFQVQMVDIQCVDQNPIEELPNRIKCGAHGFNSMCKTDAHYSLIASTTYRRTYVVVFRKLNQLWNKILQKHGGETIRKYLGRNIIRPHKIRWTSIYNSVNTFSH